MRRTLPFALSLLIAAAACGPAEVVVTMEIDVQNPDGEGTMQLLLSDVEVQLIPFDRDAVFDSITTAYGTPEPEIPAELLERRPRFKPLRPSGTPRRAVGRRSATPCRP